MATIDKKIFPLYVTILCALVWGCPSTSFAIPVLWNLKNVEFVDGGTATGFLVYDADTSSILNWKITVTGGDTGTFPDFIYGKGLPHNISADVQYNNDPYGIFTFYTDLKIQANPYSPRELRLALGAPITDFGEVVPLVETNPLAAECYNCNPYRLYKSGGMLITQAPELTSFTAFPNVLWPPNNKLLPVTVAPIPSELVNCQITSVSSNELITTADYQITGALTVNLLAKRLGKGEGRVYTIDVSCLNNLGYQVTGNVTVTVPHDQGKGGNK